MKKINIIYWISTLLICFVMAGSGIAGLMASPESVKMMHEHMGYPVYFLYFISIAKILGAIAILMPGFPKLKEWAFAGFAFDLIGATWSTFATGTTVVQNLPMLIFFALLAVSYIYYRKRLAAKQTV